MEEFYIVVMVTRDKYASIPLFLHLTGVKCTFSIWIKCYKSEFRMVISCEVTNFHYHNMHMHGALYYQKMQTKEWYSSTYTPSYHGNHPALLHHCYATVLSYVRSRSMPTFHDFQHWQQSTERPFPFHKSKTNNQLEEKAFHSCKIQNIMVFMQFCP